jgi:hypothetical protein
LYEHVLTRFLSNAFVHRFFYDFVVEAGFGANPTVN